MQVQPYLFFDGRCEEAIEFYRRTLGAEVQMLMRFKDAPQDACPQGGFAPGTENKVMHGSLQIGSATVLVSDGRNTGKPNFQGFGLALDVASDADAKRTFDALSDGGQVQAPLSKTFFASSFGMVVDRFGVLWMVLVPTH
jgi:PhnB protein